MATQRIWLDVAYAEKDAAKALGARWDPGARRWYAPPNVSDQLLAWAPRPDLPGVLPGEDRTLGQGLFVDMVPQSCWFTNARSSVSGRDWERLRRMVLRRAEDRCEACAAPEHRELGRTLDVHERWVYLDQAERIQRLGRLVCLCSDCHVATHFGLARLQGRAAFARKHLARVTGMSEREVHEHIDRAGALWQDRSQHVWELDLSILTAAGVEVTRPAPPVGRADEGARRLAEVLRSERRLT